ncbi:hypothetical protein BH10ACT1_BH10ACT1_03090 [soil metagenome]
MLRRMGIAPAGGPDPDGARQRFLGKRTFEDLDIGLELLISTMLRVLFVEIKAFHVIAWAEELLSDPDLVAGDGEAGRLVSLHPRRRDAPRGVPAHRAHRDARPHLRG